MPLTTRWIEIQPGLSLPCLLQGSPSGTPLLLLHGYTDSCRSFDRLLPHLPAGLRALAPSQRGHGKAGRPDDGYGPADLAADAVALLDALGIGRAIIVGHSMGSQVALRLALDHPARVRGLVLLNGFPTLGGNPVVRGFWDEAVSTLSDPIDPALVEAFQRSTVARPIPEAFLRMVVQESLRLPANLWRAVLRGQMETDLSAEISRISVPTVLIWGEQDALIPLAVQQAMATAIPAARLEVLPGTGHAAHWEEPERVAMAIVEFVRNLGADVRPEEAVA